MAGNRERKKEEFTRKLKGDPVGYDAFGRPVMEGDLLIFAAGVNRAAELRVIKIITTLEDTGYGSNKDNVKLRIQRAERSWRGGGKDWRLQKNKSIIQKLENTYLLEEPPQFILDIFDGEEDE